MNVLNIVMRKWRQRSVQGAVVVISIVGFTLFFCVDAWFAYDREIIEVERQQDQALKRETLLLKASLDQLISTERGPSVQQHLMSGFFRYRVSTQSGDFVQGDPHLAPPSPALIAAMGVKSAPVLYDDVFRGDRVRATLSTLRDGAGKLDNSLMLQVIGPPYANDLGAALARNFSQMIARSLIALALVATVLWLTLRPLRELRSELMTGDLQDFRKLSEERPAELVPIVQALNRLIVSQQQVAEQQRKFLADASHQLRTPLAVIRTQLQGLSSGQFEIADTVPKILRTVDRATSLTSQLLSLEKVRHLVRQSDWIPLDLSAIVSDIALELSPLMVRKRLDFEFDAVPVWVMSDPWMIGELIRNLLANAIHHSAEFSALGIVIRRFRGDVELIVWDHGGGVSDSVRARLFEPFSAADGGTGIGLGLAICREIAESMSASVHIFNRQQHGHVIGCDAVVRWPSAAVCEPISGTTKSASGSLPC